MKKILLLLFAALPLVFGSCSSDDEEINGTSGSIDVTVTFSDEDIAAKRNYHKYFVYLISTAGYTLTTEMNCLHYNYYINGKDANGNPKTLRAEWQGKGAADKNDISAHVWKKNSVFPYGKCIVILEEWSGPSSWYRYIETSVGNSNEITIPYGSPKWSESISCY